ncbi:NDP-hexose 2,3-dehydratase family protein [Candidatus Uhrbacteria bacterium]|nr:NDP-hexose 2,3-dehydratase family protein [Candidatus Uhrbacteria bacterium]
MSTKVFERSDEFVAWATDRASALAMEVERTPLSSLAPTWVTDYIKIARPDGQYFSVEGFQIKQSGGREVSGWSQPMIVQPSGYVGLIRRFGSRIDPDKLLVRLFPEPGNIGIRSDLVNTRVLVGPPIQFSKGNLENHIKALNGELDPNGKSYKQVPFASIATESKKPTWVNFAVWESAVEDGGRFFEKANKYVIVNVLSIEDVEAEIQLTGQPENFAWINIYIWRTLRQSGFLNGHMRSVSSMLI